ncbi:MAG: cation diffusion facilitator family transporter [Candidatus Aminicenantes bacterium]|nr:cation diffusion facilitator family transporter [Candidatus Aminicenantes bacterium]
MEKKRAQTIYTSSLVALIGNAILSVSKVVVGLVAHSLAVLSDGIDSATDVIASFVTMVASKIISKPPDIQHPFGHKRAEAIATKVVAFIIFFIGAQLIITTINRIIHGELRVVPGPVAFYVTLFSIAGKIFLAVFLFKKGRKTRSTMLKANAVNMRNDIFISLSVLVGLFCTYFLSSPITDYIVAILVSLWIIKSAIQIFWTSSLEVMDGIKDESLYSIIFSAVEEVPGAANPHRTRIQPIGDMYMISIDVEVSPKITVGEGHNVAINVEQKIREKVENVYDVVVHIEPHGNIEDQEKFGVSKQTIESS